MKMGLSDYQTDSINVGHFVTNCLFLECFDARQTADTADIHIVFVGYFHARYTAGMDTLTTAAFFPKSCDPLVPFNDESIALRVATASPAFTRFVKMGVCWFHQNRCHQPLPWQILYKSVSWWTSARALAPVPQLHHFYSHCQTPPPPIDKDGHGLNIYPHRLKVDTTN